MDGYVAVTEWLRALRAMKMSKGKEYLKEWLLNTEVAPSTVTPPLLILALTLILI